MTKSFFSIIFAAILLAIVLNGCSKLKNDQTPVAPSPVNVHPEGFKDNITSADFHGKTIAKQNYDLGFCKKCHGYDYKGGSTNVSCLICHNKVNGPENCTTCHGSSVNAAPPKDLTRDSVRTARGVGAHQIHLLGGTMDRPFACTECHKVPKTINDAGHIDQSSGAEIIFDSTSVFYKSNAKYNSQTVSCENVYCHGNFANGNTTNMPVWNDVSGSASACGTCHGDKNAIDPQDKARPKTISQGGTHPDKGAFGTTTCSNCHGLVIDINLKFTDPSKHINGKVD